MLIFQREAVNSQGRIYIKNGRSRGQGSRKDAQSRRARKYLGRRCSKRAKKMPLEEFARNSSS